MYRVVLVDDEQIISQGLQRAFPWAEYDCEVAGVAMDGQEGLKLIREVKPDLLLTDICMPNMDGLTMIAALKSAFPAMQVAVLTAYRDFDYAQKALNLGVCRYLLKPNPPKTPAKRALSSPGRPWTTSASTTPST